MEEITFVINMFDMYLSLNKENKMNTRFIRERSIFFFCSTYFPKNQKSQSPHNNKEKLSFFTVQKGENAKMEMKSGLDMGQFNGTDLSAKIRIQRY